MSKIKDIHARLSARVFFCVFGISALGCFKVKPFLSKVCRVLLPIVVFTLFLSAINYVQLSAAVENGGYGDVLPSRRVLILNSYHPGFAWTETLEDAVMKRLIHRYPDIDLASEYLNWKRFPDEEALALLKPALKDRYQNMGLDLVITTDDAALSFALQYRMEFFNNAPVVFMGVSREHAEMFMQTNSNFTGVTESVDIRGTAELALAMRPSTRRVILVYENSESGIPVGEKAELIFREIKPELEVEHWNSLPSTVIRDKSKYLPDDTFIFFAVYSRSAEGLALPMPKFADLLFAESSVPVFGIHEFVIGHNVLGGRVFSGRIHAEVAAEYALRVLEGESVNDIELYIDDNSTLMFDYNVMRRFGIKLWDVPRESQIINSPFEFIENNRNVALAVLAGFFLFCIFTLWLSIVVKRLKRSEAELRSNQKTLISTNIQLLGVNQQLVSVDESLRRRNNELEEQKQELEKNQETIRQLAYNDALTKLPNRALMRNVAEEAIFAAEASNRILGIMFIDLDNFKVINDSLGHPTGDAVLESMGRRLRSSLSKDWCLARSGGDEFIVLIPEVSSIASVAEGAYAMLSEFRLPLEVNGVHFHLGLSIGIAIYPRDGEDFDTLLRSADIAMYAAKAVGKNQFRFFDDDMKTAAQERFLLEDGLRHAIERNELSLEHQAIHTVDGNALIGFESLLRWKSKALGNIAPRRFIPVAEESGLIESIGYWVLEETCRFAYNLGESLNEKTADKLPEEFYFCVNVSGRQLIKSNFAEIVKETLGKSGTRAQRIVLEITESVLMDSVEEQAERLLALRVLGLTIALDDFGTGYSSLTYLEKLPIQWLKIDKAFIDGIMSTDEPSIRAGSIVALASGWGMSVVAEGVEHKLQRDYLLKHNCDMLQGYLCSRPIPEHEALVYAKRLQANNAVKAPNDIASTVFY